MTIKSVNIYFERSGKLNSYRQKNDLFLSDYLSISNVKDARVLTDQIFKDNKNYISRFELSGYKVLWSWYSEVFQYSLIYLRLENFFKIADLERYDKIFLTNIPNNYCRIIGLYYPEKEIINNSRNNNSIRNLIGFFANFFGLIFSIISILILSIGRKNKYGLYSGDYVYKDYRCDFRLKKVYEELESSNKKYVEFIRMNSTRNLFLNFFKRRRFLIYTNSLEYFINIFTPTRTREVKHNFGLSLLSSFEKNTRVIIKTAKLLRWIFRLINLKKFFLISFSARSASLGVAAKISNVESIGIMHGLQQKEYAVYEFMESYEEQKKIGCDKYGVWSEHYLEYFKKYSKISLESSFHYCGLLRPYKSFNNRFKRVKKDKIRVLFISEPLIDVKEISPFLNEIIGQEKFEIGIKIRPMINDGFAERLQRLIPGIKNIKVHQGLLLDIASEYDFFVGSHSTAVIEASIMGKLSILFDTKMFGDYFEIKEKFADSRVFISSPKEFPSILNWRIENEEEVKSIQLIRERFFGENKNGAKWVVNQLN